MAAKSSAVVKEASYGECIPHMFSCECKSNRPGRRRDVVTREGTVIETTIVGGRCVGDHHGIDPDIDHFSFNELMFASFNNIKRIIVVVSVATFYIVVMIVVNLCVSAICV